MTEGDLLGLPKVEGNVTKCLTRMVAHCLQRTCCPVLGRVDRATLEVRQGIFELCDSRKIAGYHFTMTQSFSLVSMVVVTTVTRSCLTWIQRNLTATLCSM